MNVLNALDIRFTKYIYLLIPHNRFFDLFFSFFSLRGNSIIIWAAIIILVLLLEERKNPGIQKRDVFFLTTFLISFLTISLLVSFVLKNIFQRPRPTYSNAPHITASVISRLAQCPKDYSFPSGHASAAFASATVITAFDKKRKWFYYAVAVLISLSRIYLGCHYFLDVVGGAMAGWMISKLILQINKFNKYYK